MLKKRNRLTARDIEILSTDEQRKSVHGALLSLRFLPAQTTRISVTASKKTIARAVDRTRVRRRLYAAAEKPMADIRRHAIVMILPKKDCLAAPFKSLESEIAHLFGKAGLLG